MSQLEHMYGLYCTTGSHYSELAARQASDAVLLILVSVLTEQRLGHLGRAGIERHSLCVNCGHHQSLGQINALDLKKGTYHN